MVRGREEFEISWEDCGPSSFRMRKRRRSGDLIETLRTLVDLTDVVEKEFFGRRPSESRWGHSWKLEENACTKDSRVKSYSIRIINDWKWLLEVVVQTENVIAFERLRYNCSEERRSKVQAHCPIQGNPFILHTELPMIDIFCTCEVTGWRFSLFCHSPVKIDAFPVWSTRDNKLQCFMASLAGPRQ